MAHSDSFSDYLKTQREKREVQQVSLAKDCEVSRGYVAMLESGRQSPPTYEKCKQLADSLGLSEPERMRLYELALLGRTSKDTHSYQASIKALEHGRSPTDSGPQEVPLYERRDLLAPIEKSPISDRVFLECPIQNALIALCDRVSDPLEYQLISLDVSELQDSDPILVQYHPSEDPLLGDWPGPPGFQIIHQRAHGPNQIRVCAAKGPEIDLPTPVYHRHFHLFGRQVGAGSARRGFIG